MFICINILLKEENRKAKTRRYRLRLSFYKEILCEENAGMIIVKGAAIIFQKHTHIPDFNTIMIDKSY